MYFNLASGLPKLADHVNQVVFVGDTGFRFPVGHYETNGDVTADMLTSQLWCTIIKLAYYGFQVNCFHLSFLKLLYKIPNRDVVFLTGSGGGGGGGFRKKKIKKLKWGF